MLKELLEDPEYREELAKAAYYRERAEDAAADAEHELEPATYLALSWESLSSHSQRPYLTTATHVCDELARVASAA